MNLNWHLKFFHDIFNFHVVLLVFTCGRGYDPSTSAQTESSICFPSSFTVATTSSQVSSVLHPAPFLIACTSLLQQPIVVCRRLQFWFYSMECEVFVESLSPDRGLWSSCTHVSVIVTCISLCWLHEDFHWFSLTFSSSLYPGCEYKLWYRLHAHIPLLQEYKKGKKTRITQSISP